MIQINLLFHGPSTAMRNRNEYQQSKQWLVSHFIPKFFRIDSSHKFLKSVNVMVIGSILTAKFRVLTELPLRKFVLGIERGCYNSKFSLKNGHANKRTLCHTVLIQESDSFL